MKVTVVDINNIEIFVSLEDGRILSIPANTMKNPKIGDILDIPQMNISCSNNRCTQSNIIVNNLIDFF